MLLRNVWYVAGYSADLAPGQHLGRKYLNESVVLFRTRSGVLSALQDRCSHRVCVQNGNMKCATRQEGATRPPAALNAALCFDGHGVVCQILPSGLRSHHEHNEYFLA